MKIYTKRGDSGQTSLVGGQRVSKASDRVNAYGDTDELISYIGLIRCKDLDFDKELRHIQEDLMLAAAHIASEGEPEKLKLKPFPAEEIDFLEHRIDELTDAIPPQTAFILPSRPCSAAITHIARSVCRRAERSCVALNDDRENVVLSIKYLNRLSDYLFELGRYFCYKNNISEDFWTV